VSAVAHFQDRIAERERELVELEELKRKVQAMEARPVELRNEIAALRRQEQEHLADAQSDYSDAVAPYVQAREAAVALVPQLAEAIEKALDARADLEAAYRSVVNLGIEPATPKPDRVEVMQMRDRELQNQFVRLMSALSGRF
jgi:chromosome segregation ATPase